MNEQISVIKASIYIEQVFKMTRSDEAKHLLIDLVFSGELLKMQCLHNSPFYYYIKTVIGNRLYHENIRENIRLSFERLYERITDVDDYSDMLREAMSAEFIEYYHLKDIFLDSNRMYYILRPVEYDNFKKISKQYICIFGHVHGHEDEYNNVLEVFRDFIIEKLSEIARNNAQESIYQKISDEFENYVDKKELELLTRNEVSDEISDYIDNELSSFDQNLLMAADVFDLDKILSYIDFEGAIESVSQERKDDYYDDERRSDWRSEYDEISYMFER